MKLRIAIVLVLACAFCAFEAHSAQTAVRQAPAVAAALAPELPAVDAKSQAELQPAIDRLKDLQKQTQEAQAAFRVAQQDALAAAHLDPQYYGVDIDMHFKLMRPLPKN